ncbi:urea carboxylase [Alicyclobacillus vulcanalis]|uniref:Urea carboxylase n=1 Tax=Alicyclobacillus vulcanalis TaxID=252246 RepID=A0A1N7N580_9BACL|nr:urea carboxylase [Alicyclobacillus vulcanalis]SIS93311.1 urea carboxylase [Alicyclobacillus vulcanalis]
MFRKVLIANRGAIAVRIIRTLKHMGISSVAVYTTADEDSLHVDLADEAIWIGEGPANESYVNPDQILAAAKEACADAIHPGYGFLSENAAFARRCAEEGLVFIGPSPDQIEQFGYKHVAREVARQAGVPLLPGSTLMSDIGELRRAAERIGYPVILKSTAGGGGIGMRVVEREDALEEAFESVRRLSGQHFRDDGVFVEKYVPRARHIEVQIFGNRQGEIVAIGERDCTLQRRNQKVVEECPAHGLSEATRRRLHEAALAVARAVGYRSAGTVEFLYDPASDAFYFLEVNTRLQVEHGVTEEVYGIDLVEWMIREAAGELTDLAARLPKPSGHSIQVRVYAEDPGRDFRPCAGRVDGVVWPKDVRVETWIGAGVTVSAYYDPLLAKLIVRGATREEAVGALRRALAEARVHGVQNNLRYLQAIAASESFATGDVHTKWLEGFRPSERALEVVDGGLQSTIQDWPGRTGLWDVGVPPSGPMDALSMRIGNRLLGNPEGAPALELTLRGGAYSFRADVWICLTGADMQATLDGDPVPRYQPVLARRGQLLRFGESRAGLRAYLCVQGGFDVAPILGSRATFALGGFGGHGGRALIAGDVVGIGEPPGDAPALAASDRHEAAIDGAEAAVQEAPPVEPPAFERTWEIGVVPGPHCTPEFLPASYLEMLTSTEWKVHFNSSRTGIRLVGPAPVWAREDGGDAGLHPSNLHDNPYAIGSLNLTGDLAVLLGQDGPSLGGFVCPVTTPAAEMWKIGQLRPGDAIRFRLLSLDQARELDALQAQCLATPASYGQAYRLPLPESPFASYEEAQEAAYLARESDGHAFSVCIRAAGDEYVLVEFGDMELDLRYRFQVHLLMEAIRAESDIPWIDLTPGIRSLQIHFDRTRMTSEEVARRVLHLDAALPDLSTASVPSRIVRMPLSFDDPSVQLAIERYQKNVRPDAPWCPSNIEFMRRVNGLDRIEDVRQTVFEAKYLVLGLGDVYLGAPAATPVDPRHRLVTTKYNPARTWTPENAVGIGGSYMCIYGMESPGGYQLFGRTLQIWNTFRQTGSFRDGKPWLLRFFDQVEFYPVTPEALDEMRKRFVRGRHDIEILETVFDLGEYLAFLESIRDDAAAFKERQKRAFREELARWKAMGLAAYTSEEPGEPEEPEDYGLTVVRAQMPGSVWKVHVAPGQWIRPGDTIAVIESMKMEFPVEATCQGVVRTVHVRPGQELRPGGPIVGIEEVSA